MLRGRTWRHASVRLAFQRGLDGQALFQVQASDNYDWYVVPSVNEPDDHHVLYDRSGGNAYCDCEAGERAGPCAHAGAVLLLVAKLVEERERPPDGMGVKPDGDA